MKSALITGHLGFIGRHFYRALQEEGGWVISTCDIASGPNTPAHHEPRDCREGFAQDAWQDMDLVIHCAATIPPIDQRERNDLIVAQDLAIDATMFQWALRTKPKKIVFFSSSAAYPIDLQRQPYQLVEDDIDLHLLHTPDAMYGMTKLVGELQAAEAKRLGIDVLVLRPFSGYGSDQSEDYPFRAFVERARRREPVFQVWGDGSQVRDFIHVDDIVNGTMTMLDAGFVGPVNVGTGIPTSLLELAKTVIAEIPGYSPALQLNNAKPTGAVYRCCDPTLLHSVYQPAVGLQEGVKRALEGL